MRVKNSRTRSIVRYLALAGGVVALSVAAPLLPHQLLKAYMRSRRFEKQRFLQDLKRLQERELIAWRELPNGTVEMQLRTKGKESAVRYHFDTMAIERPKRWDGIWHLVTFDISRKQNKARDALRMKLKELGFYQLQNSVFIFPFPCEKELGALATFWGVGNSVLLMEVSRFEGEEKLKRHFRLAGSS